MKRAIKIILIVIIVIVVLIIGLIIVASVSGGMEKGSSGNTLDIGVNRVTFNSQGTQIVGNLIIPENYKRGNKLPALIFITPATGVKEQVAGTYAEKMAESGYITLAFDHRTYGESDGEPRSTENLYMKSEDIKSAVSFIRSLEQVNENKIGAVGICAGAGYLVQTAVGDTRIKAVATISGTLSFKGLIAVSGGDAILAMAGDARQKYDDTGEVTYFPVISNPSDETNIFAKEAYEYYVGNQEKYPTWKNQADISSYALFAALDIKNVISSLSKPVLFIAGTKAMTADLTQTAYDNAQDDKELYWIDGATHVSLYHNEEQISQASKKLDEFFEQKLKPQVFKNIGLDVAKYIAGFFI